jgi:hypothetical protein
MSTSTPDPQFLSALAVDETITTDTPSDESAWATVPLEDDPSPPELAGMQLVSDIADFARPLPGIEPNTGDPDAVAQEYGKDLDFDFDTGEPAGMEYGSLSYVEDEQQVEQWIYKALDTPRAHYLIYPVDYGSMLYWWKGAAGPEATIFSEVARTVEDCLDAHPRVSDSIVDAVFKERLASEAGLYISARVWIESSDDPLEIELGVTTA